MAVAQILPAALRRRLVSNHHRFAHVLPRGYRRYDVPGGHVYLDVRESPMMLARALRMFEPEKVRAFQDHLRTGMHVVDAGANKGDFSVLAAHLVGPTGRVTAVEPDPTNYHWLTRSVDAERHTNVQCLQAALGDVPGQATLHVADHSGWHTMIPGLENRSEGKIEVEVTTLDRMRSPVNALKIDVEGFEQYVLAGGARLLADATLSLVFLDLHPNLGVDVRGVAQTLADAGFVIRHPARPYAPLAVDAHTSELLATRGSRVSSVIESRALSLNRPRNARLLDPAAVSDPDNRGH